MAIGTAAAIVGSAAIGAVASGKAAKAGEKAAESAAEIQAQAQREATELQREIFETSRKDAAPWRNVGVPALSRLAATYGIVQNAPQVAPAGAKQPGVASVQKITAPPGSLEAAIQALGFNEARNRNGTKLSSSALAANFQPQNAAHFMSLDEAGRRAWLEASGFTPIEDEAETTPQFADVSTLPQPGPDPLTASQQDVSRIAEGFKASPGYSFRLQEGQDALLNASRARGMALSGGALKESQRFGEGLAADEFDTFMRRGLAAFGDYRSGLAGLAGVGQAANNASQVAGSNFANTAGQLITQGGANQASAILAGGAIKAGQIGNIGSTLANAGSNYMLARALQPQPPAVTGTSPSLNFWPN